jgi:hypothetical protein
MSCWLVILTLTSLSSLVAGKDLQLMLGFYDLLCLGVFVYQKGKFSLLMEATQTHHASLLLIVV